MRYVSTRGKAPDLGFEDTLLTGLASDGGLYVPESFPSLEDGFFEKYRDDSYEKVALEVLRNFIGDEIDDETLAGLIRDSYAGFHHTDITPLMPVTENLKLLELFHGPTLAFKDVALQFLGRMFDYVLEKKRRKVTIVGATSGDTGSAAIEACRDRDAIDIFILFPDGRVSDVQRRQMTTVDSANVHCIAVDGSFDDCQDLVKAMFNDARFREDMQLSAVNSINWARIAAQVVYYIYVCARLQGQADKVVFSVPTGNFGNVYAGYIARMMGAPIEKLIVSTNTNDILFRFFESGVMRQEDVIPTISPSMDIQISSNFERLLFDLLDRDANAVAGLMEAFRERKSFSLDDKFMAQVHEIFASFRFDDASTKDIIRKLNEDQAYLADPHSAVGIGAAQAWLKDSPDDTVVSLCTAHPAKFPDAVEDATGLRPALPGFLSDLFAREERMTQLPGDLEQVMAFVRDRSRQKKAA